MKKALIIGAAVIVLLAVILTVVLVLGGKETVISESGALYPYTISQNGNVAEIKITGDFGGHTWSAEEYGDEKPVKITKKSDNGKTAAFTAAPVSRGIENVSFLLRGDGVLEDCLCEIRICFSVDADGILTVADMGYTELQGITVCDEDAANAFMYSEKSDGTCELVFTGSDQRLRVAETSDQAVAVCSIRAHIDQYIYTIIPEGKGAASVRLCLTGKAPIGSLKLEIAVDENGKAAITGHSFDDYDHDAEHTEKRPVLENDLPMRVGTVSFPAEAKVLETKDITFENGGASADGVWVDINIGNVRWRYFAAPKMPEGGVEKILSLDVSAGSGVKVGECAGHVYQVSGGLLITWNNSAGDGFGLAAEGVSADDARAAAESIFKLTPALKPAG